MWTHFNRGAQLVRCIHNKATIKMWTSTSVISVTPCIYTCGSSDFRPSLLINLYNVSNRAH